MVFFGARLPKANKFLTLLSVGGTTIAYFTLQRDWSWRRFENSAEIPGKTVVVTGANSGMGKELASELAARGGRIILACRDLAKCEEVREEFIEATHNRQISCKHLDLSSLNSVREFAKDIIANEHRLDILVNNAGIMGLPEKEVTKEGFEKMFGVNYLGHFLLTNLLHEKMQKSSTPAASSRIINITSGVHKRGNIHFPDINYIEKTYEETEAFAQSELALLLFTLELAKRTKGTGVNVYAVNPGLVDTGFMERYHTTKSSKFFQWWTKPFRYVAMKSPKQGIQTTLMCALDRDLENATGKYYHNGREDVHKTWKEIDEDSSHLWAIAERWTHLQKGLDYRTVYPSKSDVNP